MMHDMQCKCLHHPFAKLLALLGGWTALGFFIALFTKATFLGFESLDYFMSAVVLTLAIHGMKMCSCCRHHGYGGAMQGRSMEEHKM